MGVRLGLCLDSAAQSPWFYNRVRCAARRPDGAVGLGFAPLLLKVKS